MPYVQNTQIQIPTTAHKKTQKKTFKKNKNKIKNKHKKTHICFMSSHTPRR